MSITQLLDDPIWQSIGVISSIIIGLVGIWLSVKFNQRQPDRKELAYSVLSNAPVVNINPSISSSVKNNVAVLWNNKPAQDVYLVVLKIKNTGNAPISVQDYENIPITFEFKSGTKILDAKIREQDVKNINLSIQPVKSGSVSDKIVIQPLSLNSQNEVIFRVLLNTFNSEDEIKADGWITGGAILRSDEASTASGNNWLKTLDASSNIMLSLCIIVSIAVLYSAYIDKNHTIRYILIMTMICIIFITMVIARVVLERRNPLP